MLPTEYITCLAQVCCLQLSKEGLTLRWEDVSKGLQSSVFLNSEVHALAAPGTNTSTGIARADSSTDLCQLPVPMGAAGDRLLLHHPD